ncbi:bacteriophage antitermination protein Q, partial [Proteus mirabilis]
ILIVPYIWHEFQRLNSKKRITKKVKQRLQSLTLLAIQAVKAEINQTAKKYTDVKLAELLGVSADAWRKSYKLYWICLLDCCYQLDRDSLFKISALS